MASLAAAAGALKAAKEALRRLLLLLAASAAPGRRTPWRPAGRFPRCGYQRIFRIWLLVVGVAVFLLIHLYASIGSQQRVRYRSVDFSEANVTFFLDWTIHERFFPELQRYQCRELISQDNLCQGELSGGGPPLLLLAIKSHPASNSRRAVLRRTWARPRETGGYRLRRVFLMAVSPRARHASLVQRESCAIGDVLMWDFVESHHNLSLKERCFLQWLHRHCPQAAYVFKGDDDIFVNIEALTEYLDQTPNASGYIHGHIQYHSKVVRLGKYAVSPAFYPMSHYPNFASGGGFIMPQSSISKLHEASLWLPVFPLDDVYLGFLALAAGLRFRHDGRFRVWGPPKDVLEVYRDSLMVHGISMTRIENVWRELQKRPFPTPQTQLPAIRPSSQREPPTVCSDGSVPEF